MQATVTYLLTEQAQRAQMAATGQPVPRKQIITVDVPAADLPLMQVTADGVPYLDLAGDKIDAHELLAAAGATEQISRAPYHAITDANIDILAALRAGAAKQRAKLAAARAKEDAVIRAFLSSDAEVVSSRYSVLHLPDSTDISKRTDDLATQYRAEAERRLAQYEERQATKRQEVERLRHEAAAESKAKYEAMEQAKAEAIAAFVASSGDAQIQQQYADGLLCRKVVIAMMAAAQLRAMALGAEVDAPALCDDNACACCHRVIECLPPAVYARWKGYGPLPEGATVEFRKVRRCLKQDDDYPDDEETAGPTEYHAIVTVPSGPFQFVFRVAI